MVVSFFLTHLLLEVASPLHSAAIKIQEAKDSIDEEDPRPTSSTWSYITFLKEEILLMLNLLLSSSIIRKKDPGNLGKKDTLLGGYYGFHQLQENYFI